MQGQRGSIGSSPETLNFDYGSSSSQTAIDQQIRWNYMRNTAENIIPDYLLSPGDMNIALMNSMSHGQQSMSRWSFGEPNSSLSLDDVNLNPMFTQSSNSDAIVQNLNLNSQFGNHGGENHQVIGCPNIHKSAESENAHIPSSSDSDSFLLHSKSGEILADLHHDRPGSSMEGHRTSCKRKALEENVAQSSISGSNYSRSSSLSISAQPEQDKSRLRLRAREVTSSNISDSSNGESPESSRRNFRIRLNSSKQQDSISPTLLSTESAFRHPGASSSQVSPRLLPIDHPLDLRSMPAMDNTVPQSQSEPVVVHVPALAGSVQSFGWNGGSKSRNGNSLSSLGDRLMTRNILEHPTFLPPTDIRILGQNPINRSLGGGNTSVHGSTTSTSRTRPSLGVPLPSGPWLPHENPPPPQYPRRVAEYVRRQLFSASGIETGGQTSNYSPLNSGPASSRDMVHPSGGGSLAHHSLHPRPAWMERHDDGQLGIPYSLRTLAAASEGRGSNRLVSEIRNVLGIMRRGEGLRFEDVMLLDHSGLFGMADIHDRHHDMRLDVDNMSYEELLALEERIGNVSTGLSEEAIITRLKKHKYSNGVESQLKAEPEPCCICQEEYNAGEDLGKLECGHDFHADCIKQWLMQKNLCPICKTTGLETT